MMELWKDVLYATRRLQAAPAFTTFAVVTLALGIGATTAIYSVIHATVLTPPHIRDVDRVVNIYHSDPTRSTAGWQFFFSWPDYQDLRAAQTSFSVLAAWARFRETLVARGSGEVVFGEMVSADYFGLVGVDAALGRTIDASDDRASAEPVVVLSNGLWRRRFDANPQVLGTTVRLNGHAFVVIGVAPATFRGVDMPNVMATTAWVPLSVASRLTNLRNADGRMNRESRWLGVKGRLKPQQTVSAAAVEIAAIGRNLDRLYPIDRDQPAHRRMSPHAERQWHLIPTADLMLHESTHRIAAPLATTIVVVVALVLLVACTNLANLLLARSTSRRHELAVKLAMGASSLRLVREQLTEAFLVCVAGGLLAFAVAHTLMAGVLSTPVHAAPGVMIQIEPSFERPVVAVAAAAAVLAFLIFGVGPAIHLTRSNLRDVLATDRSTALPRWRGRQALIAGQVAVSVALSAVAGLFGQQIARNAINDTGVDLERLALVTLDFRLQAQDEPVARETLRAVLELSRRERGVEAVTLSSGLPFGVDARQAVVTSSNQPMPEDSSGGPFVRLISASPDFLARSVYPSDLDERSMNGIRRRANPWP